MTFEEKLQKRIGDIQAGCKTITMLPGWCKAMQGRLSIRHLISELVHDILYAPEDLPRTIKRFFKFAYQTARRGFADDEIWGLNSTLCTFILPRLKAFRDGPRGGVPTCIETEQEWNEILDKMVWSMERVDDDQLGLKEGEYPDYKRIEEGLTLFGKYFMNLWD